MRRKVGIVGYGHLGQHLAHKIIKDENVSKQLEIGFIWNRSVDKIKEDKLIPESVILENLSNFDSVKVDIIIEVAHPSITLYDLSLLCYSFRSGNMANDSFNMQTF